MGWKMRGESDHAPGRSACLSFSSMVLPVCPHFGMVQFPRPAEKQLPSVERVTPSLRG